VNILCVGAFIVKGIDSEEVDLGFSIIVENKLILARYSLQMNTIFMDFLKL